jgi:hypothetical protein
MADGPQAAIQNGLKAGYKTIRVQSVSNTVEKNKKECKYRAVAANN